VAAFNERTASQEEGLGAVIDKQRSGAPLPHLRGAHRRVTTSWPVPSLYCGTVTQLTVTLRRFAVETGPEARNCGSGSASSTYVTAEATAVGSPAPRLLLRLAGIGATSRRPRARHVHRSVQSRLGRIGELSCM